MKNITILGSTGSIGVNALNVIDNLNEDYKVFGLSAYKNIDTILVLDFGGNKTATSGDFTIQWPANTATDAIIRLGD